MAAPILTIAHGTTGIADACAPSTGPARTELALMGPAIDAGYLVAMSDYEGLGTPGRHPYLVGESEGRGVLDAARAAGQLPDADPGEQLAIFGYSQGGHGALWAGQLAPEWTPELELVGTVAGAPATEMPVIVGRRGPAPDRRVPVHDHRRLRRRLPRRRVAVRGPHARGRGAAVGGRPEAAWPT